MTFDTTYDDNDSPGVAAKKARLRAAMSDTTKLSGAQRRAKADTLRNVRGTEQTASDSANTQRLQNDVMSDGVTNGVGAMLGSGVADAKQSLQRFLSKLRGRNGK